MVIEGGGLAPPIIENIVVEINELVCTMLAFGEISEDTAKYTRKKNLN